MRPSNRSFPHPVLGNADDFPESDFQVTLDIHSDKSNYYLDISVRCSNEMINRMIKRGLACYSLHVECSNTLFRNAFDFHSEEHRITITETSINNTVEVVPLIRAVKSIQDYDPKGAHSDYEGCSFPITPGDILAIGDGQTFEANHEIDPMRRVGALMIVLKSSKSFDHPMEADFTTDPNKILIKLCESDFDAYSKLKSQPHLTSHLTTTLVLPVLVEAITVLYDSEDPPTGKWAEILRLRLEAIETTSNSILEKAQLLLDMPIRRALSAAETYANSKD